MARIGSRFVSDEGSLQDGGSSSEPVEDEQTTGSGGEQEMDPVESDPNPTPKAPTDGGVGDFEAAETDNLSDSPVATNGSESETTSTESDVSAEGDDAPELSTTGMGTSGTRQSRLRARTRRAGQSRSLSTTGFGTSGTRRSRLRERTQRASEGENLGTDTLGATQGESLTEGDSTGDPGTSTSPEDDREPFEAYDETPEDTNYFDRQLGNFDEKVSGVGKTLVDAALQDPEELGLGEDTVNVSGPSLTLEQGEQGELNTDITDELTAGKGLITDEKSQRLRGKISRRRELLTPIIPGTEAGEFVTSVTGSEAAGSATAGAANVPVELISSGGAGILLAGDVATEAAVNAPRVVGEYGAGETALAGLEVGGRVVKSQTQAAKENPYQAGGEIVGGFLTGAAAFKGIEAAGDIGRTARLSRTDTVDYEDITTQKGSEGELPRFDTDPDAPTSEAVQEVRERAADNPDTVTQRTGGDTLYHGTQSNFGRDIDVGEGASELPGLFTSPEASPIALQGLRSSLSRPSLKPRAPDVSGKSDRFVALPGDRVDAIPEGRGGAGYELRDVDTGEQVTGGLGRGRAKSMASDRDDVEVAPDQTTSGYEFLSETAEEGTAYVRPSGQRTTELEAVYGPGSEFTRTGRVSVVVGRRQLPGTDFDIPGTGRKVPMDTFRRTDTDSDVDIDGDVDGDMADSFDGDTVEYQELTSELDRLSRRQEGSLTVGGGVTGLTATAFTGAGGTDITPTMDDGSDSTTTFTSPKPSGGSPTSPIDFGPTSSPTGPSDSDSPPSGPSPTAPPSSTPTAPPSGSGGPPSALSSTPVPSSGSPTGPPASSTAATTSGTPFAPSTPTTPTKPPLELPEGDSGDNGEEGDRIGVRQDVFTQFTNPLTGETDGDAADSDPEAPGFLGS